MPSNTVYVGRSKHIGKWGNPYFLINGYIANKLLGNAILAWDKGDNTIQNVVNTFSVYAKYRLEREPHWLDELKGKNLACWCPLDQPCHADILLEMANK
jgi:hypothetical protein